MTSIFRKNKKECPICMEKVHPSEAYLSYLKVNGNLELHFLHKECNKKVKKFERGKE